MDAVEDAVENRGPRLCVSNSSGFRRDANLVLIATGALGTRVVKVISGRLLSLYLTKHNQFGHRRMPTEEYSAHGLDEGLV